MTVASLQPRVPVETLEAAFVLLRERGLRLSTTRRILLQALFAADGPVSAEQVASGLNGRFETSELTSVYRNLETFESLGVVRHVHLGHGAGLYALSRHADAEFLLCEDCGRVQSVRPEALDAAREAVHSATGMMPRFSHFPIVGICADCAAGASDASC